MFAFGPKVFLPKVHRVLTSVYDNTNDNASPNTNDDKMHIMVALAQLC